jgi:MFS family permease
MMVTILRSLGAIVAGIAVAIVMVIAVELFSSIVHPFPEDFEGTVEEVSQHVERYPHWVLAVVVIAWGFAALAAAWIAGKLGNRGSAVFLGLLLIAAVFLNIVQLPYPLWFKIATPIVIPIASVCGYRSTIKPLSEHEQTQPT